MAGTLQAATSNPFLDGISGLYNIAGDAFSRYSSFLSAREMARINQTQAATPPNLVVQFPTENGLNFLSNPENTQKLFLYSGIVLLLSVGGFYLLKKG